MSTLMKIGGIGLFLLAIFCDDIPTLIEFRKDVMVVQLMQLGLLFVILATLLDRD